MPEKPSFGEALRYWLKLCFISFGGPTGQRAIMHKNYFGIVSKEG